jgi:hypothetical protein
MFNSAAFEGRICFDVKRAHYYYGIVQDMRENDIVIFWGMHTYPKRIMTTKARAARLGLEIDRSCVPAWVGSSFHDWIYPIFWIVRPYSIKWDPLGGDKIDPSGITMVGLPDQFRK